MLIGRWQDHFVIKCGILKPALMPAGTVDIRSSPKGCTKLVNSADLHDDGWCDLPLFHHVGCGWWQRCWPSTPARGPQGVRAMLLIVKLSPVQFWTWWHLSSQEPMSSEETQFLVQNPEPFLKGWLNNSKQRWVTNSASYKSLIYFQKFSNNSGSHPNVKNQVLYNQERSR